ncbi:hypothetical protein KJ633_02890 [bacterium]|nr:hypothetical protein [bacterium]MBU3955383.1 hypothetical protein [bacterium]
MDDQEKLSLRKQVEILNLQKDVLSRQLSKLRNDISGERSEFQKKQTTLLDDIREKDIEIRAVRNYMEKRDSEVKNQLKDEFRALEMEKERIAEVGKELDARRDLIEGLITEKQSEFEKRLKTEEELFEKSRDEYLKNSKKMQAQFDEYLHKSAVDKKQADEELNNLREQLLRQKNTIEENRKTIASFSVAGDGKDIQIEKLKKEISVISAGKETLSLALGEKTNLLAAAGKTEQDLKESVNQIKAAMFSREKELSEKNTLTKEKTSVLSAEIEKLKKDNNLLLSEAVKKARENTQTINDLRKLAEKDKKLLDNSVKRIITLKDKNNGLTKLKTKNTELAESQSELEQKLKNIQSAKAKEIAMLQKNIAEKQTTIDSLSAVTVGKDGQIEELKKEISVISADKETLSLALGEKTNLLAAAGKTEQDLKESVNQIKAAMFSREKELSEKNTLTKEKILELSAEIDNIKGLNNHLTNVKSDIEQKLKNIQTAKTNEIADMRKNIAEKQTTIDSLSAATVEKDGQIEELKKETAILENEKTALLKKIDNMRQQSQNSEKTADALMNTIQKNETLQKLNAALETKLGKIESLRQKKDKQHPPASPAATRNLKFKCSECGALVGANDKKCPSCGEKFD